MRIAHFTSAHPWDDIRIFHKMCKSLAASGHEVHLIAKATEFSEETSVAGVRVHPLPPPKDRLSRMLTNAKRASDTALSLKADIYHFHDPELMPWAWLLQLRSGRPAIYDVHEDYRVNLRSREWLPYGSGRLAELGVGMVEDFLASRFGGVVAATAKIESRFAKLDNKELVCNYPIEDELFKGSLAAAPADGKRIFSYVGGISAARGAKELVKAVGMIDEPDVELHLAGMWESETLRSECRALPGWAKVVEHGQIKRDAVAQLLSRSVAGMLPFLPFPNHVEALPNKLFEYLSAGIPVIASDFPLWRSIVDASACGLLADSLKPEEVAKAMKWMLSHPEETAALGRNGRKAIQENYNWSSESPKLEAFYKKVLASWNLEHGAA